MEINGYVGNEDRHVRPCYIHVTKLCSRKLCTWNTWVHCNTSFALSWSVNWWHVKHSSKTNVPMCLRYTTDRVMVTLVTSGRTSPWRLSYPCCKQKDRGKHMNQEQIWPSANRCSFIKVSGNLCPVGLLIW